MCTSSNRKQTGTKQGLNNNKANTVYFCILFLLLHWNIARNCFWIAIIIFLKVWMVQIASVVVWFGRILRRP